MAAASLVLRCSGLMPTSIRTSAGSASVLRGMKKQKKNKKGGAVDDGADNDDSYRHIVIPPAARPTKKLSAKDLDERAFAVKQWARYCMRKEHEETKRRIEVAVERDNALDELKRTNLKLYLACLQPDRSQIPLHFPVLTDTPPIEGFSTSEAMNLGDDDDGLAP